MVLFSISVILISCKVEDKNGILGIQVPIGSGKVSADNPYLVSGVFEDSPAYKAGIKPGDIIVQIDEMPISSGMKFDEIFSKYLIGKPGTKVTIYIKRDTENLIFEVVRARRGD